ncbi:Iron-sulfur cluster assembly accessory protein [alpha proteobacterium HIMB114]|jgi:iron-sulfur cluster assembly protein|nr:Iron-sulfur cluster assembly accessory protein [alpha proteobacterium HIMB114]
MSSILTFSNQAKTRLKEIMSSDEYKNALGLRISVKSGGCAGMTYDMNYVEQLIDGDEKIEVEGVNVFIDPKAIMYLLGTEMDYKVDKFTSSFVFNNPNETERCGCGESFKI